MARLILIGTLILLVSLLTFAHGDEPSNEPSFPRLLNPSNPNQRKIHIKSERFDSNGKYTQAEELIDLDSGRAAYIETSEGVRTTWLVDTREDTIYKYEPFICNKDKLSELSMDLPNIVWNGKPKIEVPGSNDMLLFGVSGLLESIRQENSKTYSRAANQNGTVGERIGHNWVVNNHDQFHVRFSSSAAAAAGQTSELTLNSFEINEDGRTTNVNVLSIGYELPHAAYHKELQLPLIYGCTRDPKLSAEMQAKFDIIAADQSGSYHLKAKARAMSFVGGNPTSTEPSSVELALSRPSDASSVMSPVMAHMARQSKVKTVVEQHLQVKYEANSNDGGCIISNAANSSPMGAINLASLKFSDELTLNLTSKTISMMLHEVKEETFLRLEHHGSNQFAYFADTSPEVFGSSDSVRTIRVVKKFSFAAYGRPKLESLAVWILEWHMTHLRMREVYDFDIVESKSLASDANSAQAFDISRECYLNNPDMQQGLDYAWFELDYSLPAEQIEALRNKVEELKTDIYQSIRSNLKLSYLRVPKMEIIFGDSGFKVVMLALDRLLPHQIYKKMESLALSEHMIVAKEQVPSLRACSQFCLKHKCTGMSFNRVLLTCSVVQIAAHSDIGSFCVANADTDTYRMTGQSWAVMPNDELRLERLIAAMQANDQSAATPSHILGLEEFSSVQGSGDLSGFNKLRILFKVNGQPVELIPSGSRVM